MSAVLKDLPQLAAMRESDLDAVLAIEKAVYTHPWMLGNFADSLRSGYTCRTWRADGALVARWRPPPRVRGAARATVALRSPRVAAWWVWRARRLVASKGRCWRGGSLQMRCDG